MFAGPNGSGKSTVTANFQALPNFPTNYANADEIAKTLSGDAMAQSYQAARMVEQQRLDWVATKQSFAFETVMSHPSTATGKGGRIHGGGLLCVHHRPPL